MINEAMPTFLDKDLLMDVQYQKVTEKAKDYEFGYCFEFGSWDLGFLVYRGDGVLLQSYRVIINLDVSLELHVSVLTRMRNLFMMRQPIS
jgi:hypothetical protein